MRLSPLALCVLLLALLPASGCGTMSVRKTTNVLDFLYPEGTPALPPQQVTLTLPLRVGLAFAPGGKETLGPGGFGIAPGGLITETKKQELLERIAAAFRARDAIASVEPVPSLYLKPAGSFANLEQLATALGLNVVVLLSYDQAQFNETSNWSLTYWTLVGAYVVKGENNQTHTFVDAAVYDIPSRALLFRAAGADVRGSSATPIESSEAIRAESDAGFEAATDALIENLSAGLEAFSRQAASGTVRGQGTPAIEVKPSAEYSGVARFEGGRYVGALGPLDLAFAVLVLAALRVRRRT